MFQENEVGMGHIDFWSVLVIQFIGQEHKSDKEKHKGLWDAGRKVGLEINPENYVCMVRLKDRITQR
jgi:hypothetical protein